MINDFCGTVLYFISFKEINMVDLAHCLKMQSPRSCAGSGLLVSVFFPQSVHLSYLFICQMMMEERGRGRIHF